MTNPHIQDLKEKNAFFLKQQPLVAVEERMNYLQVEYGAKPYFVDDQLDSLDGILQAIEVLDEAIATANGLTTKREVEYYLNNSVPEFTEVYLTNTAQRWDREKLNAMYPDGDYSSAPSVVFKLIKEVAALKEELADIKDKVSRAEDNLASHQNYHQIEDVDKLLKQRVIERAQDKGLVLAAYKILDKGNRDRYCTVSEAFDALLVYNANEQGSRTPYFVATSSLILQKISGCPKYEADTWVSDNKITIGYQHRTLGLATDHNTKNVKVTQPLIDSIRSWADENRYQLNHDLHNS